MIKLTNCVCFSPKQNYKFFLLNVKHNKIYSVSDELYIYIKKLECGCERDEIDAKFLHFLEGKDLLNDYIE